MDNLQSKQLEIWMNRVRANIKQFRQNRHALSEEEQIEFIRNQYRILQAGIKVYKGYARFEGV